MLKNNHLARSGSTNKAAAGRSFQFRSEIDYALGLTFAGTRVGIRMPKYSTCFILTHYSILITHLTTIL